jgi:hypothetical protein
MHAGFWKAIVVFFLTGGVLILSCAGLLRVTLRLLDVYIHDRYFVISPSHLMLLSVLFFVVAFAIWKIGVSE